LGDSPNAGGRLQDFVELTLQKFFGVHLCQGYNYHRQGVIYSGRCKDTTFQDFHKKYFTSFQDYQNGKFTSFQDYCEISPLKL